MAKVKKIYDMCAVVGTFTNQNNETKNKYANIGKFLVMEDNSFFSVIETIPVGNWDGKISYFEQKPKETTAPPATSQSEVATSPPAGSDLPFN